MSHEVETMAYAGEVPWHGLGVPVPHDLTIEQFLKKAGLDWRVEKRPLSYTWNGETRSSGDMALVRDSDGKELTTVGNDWEPCQNIDAFRFFEEYVQAGDMNMHTAGSLREGRMVWALGKINESFDLFKGKDKVESYLLFSNPHEYGRGIDIRFTPIRVVCNNTLTLSLSMQADLSYRANHKKPLNAEEVKRTMGIAKGKLAKYKSMAEFLGAKPYTAANVLDYFRQIFPVSAKESQEVKNSRNTELAIRYMDEQPGAELGRGTWWQPYNAVTYMVDHILGQPADKTNLAKRATSLNSAWYGNNRNRKIQALELAVEMAKAA